MDARQARLEFRTKNGTELFDLSGKADLLESVKT
jgi:hypothetical protein